LGNLHYIFSLFSIGILSEFYDEKEFASVDSKYEFVYTLGFVFGPLFVAMLRHYHVSIGEWQITRYNGIAFILAWFFAALFLLILCGVTNLNEYLQDEEDRKILDDAYDHENEIFQQKPHYQQYVQQLQSLSDSQQPPQPMRQSNLRERSPTNFLVFFILAISLLLNFISNATETLIITISVHHMNLPILNLCIMVSSCLIIYAFAILRGWRWMFNKQHRRLSAFATCVFLSILSITFLVVASRSTVNYYIRVVCILLTILLNSAVGLAIANSTQNLLAMMLTEPVVFEDYITNWFSIYRLFGVAGLLFGSFFRSHMKKTFGVMGVIEVVALVIIFSQYKKFSVIKELEEEEEEKE